MASDGREMDHSEESSKSITAGKTQVENVKKCVYEQ